jgi:hypothetical protein
MGLARLLVHPFLKRNHHVNEGAGVIRVTAAPLPDRWVWRTGGPPLEQTR